MQANSKPRPPANQGHWVDDSVVNGMADWSPDANSDLANLAAELSDTQTVTISASDWHPAPDPLINWSLISNTALNFGKNLFSGKWWGSELAPGGCLAEFGEGVEDADVLAKVAPSPNAAENMVKGYAATIAARHAASRILTYPLRSSIVRSTVEAGETAAGYVAPAYLDVQVGWGLIGREIPAIAKGKCH